MKIQGQEFDTMKNIIIDYLNDGSNFKDGDPKPVEIVKTGSTAWEIAHRSGAARFCYDLSRDVYDAHIKTALAKIFPNAVFADKYHY